MGEVKECSNCGEEFIKGDGFPMSEFECCCSIECWHEFLKED